MEREILEYWNGKKMVKCDPMAVQVRFHKALQTVDWDSIDSRLRGPDWWRDESLTEEDFKKIGVTEAMWKFAEERNGEAVVELLPIICKMFKVTYIDDDQEDGMTGSELLNAYTAYNNFLISVKKNTDSKQNSQQSTEVQSPQTITNECSGTTTTPVVPSASRPYPSPEE